MVNSYIFICCQGEKGDANAAGTGIKGEPGTPGQAGPKVDSLHSPPTSSK